MSMLCNIKMSSRIARGLMAFVVGAATLMVIGVPAKAQEATLPTKNINITLNNATGQERA